MLVSRRHFFLGSLALPLLAKKPAPERPNIVLILADGLPSWVLGTYGNKEILTPNIDLLAKGGTRFLNHFVCSPEAGLSRTTLLTGKTPMQLGNTGDPAAALASLEKMVGALGYETHSSSSGAPDALLNRKAGAQPYFLTLSLGGLKPPYDGVPQKYRDLYTSTRFDTLNAERTAAANARNGKEMLGDIVGSLRKAAAAISALDGEVGSLLTKLSEKSLMGNTIVMLTSSCGALLGRHGLWDAGDGSEPVNMYDESVNTPLIWSWPGHVPAQAVRPEMVSTYDFLPTLCDLLSAPPPGGNPCGRSYVLLATGKPLPKKQPWRTTVFGHYQNADMARADRYKLVAQNQEKAKGELYDLVKDPRELVNQFENLQFLTVRTELASHLASWKQKYTG